MYVWMCVSYTNLHFSTTMVKTLRTLVLRPYTSSKISLGALKFIGTARERASVLYCIHYLT